MIGGGITNTLDLGGGQKIQDYLAGAGVSNQGPGGGTLYTQGQGFNPRPVIDTSSQQYQDLFEKYRPGIDGVYSSGFGPVTQNRTYLDLPSMQDMTALGYYDPNPMTRVDKRPMMAQFMNDLYRQPVSGDANLGFGSVQNPSSSGTEIGGVIPGSAPAEMAFPETDNQINSMPNNYNENLSLLTQPGPSFDNMSLPLFGEQEQQPGGGQAVGFDPSTVSATPGVNPIAPMPTMPTAPNMQPSHSHDDLLSGIGNLFQQYFPQQNTQQINQSAPQPSFDAFGNNTTQQPASNQVFGNMITPNFGGGY